MPSNLYFLNNSIASGRQLLTLLLRGEGPAKNIDEPSILISSCAYIMFILNLMIIRQLASQIMVHYTYLRYKWLP